MKLLLLLDYDGTLTPVVKKPEEAILSKSRKAILKLIAVNPDIKMAVISGRSLIDIKVLVGIRGIDYVGNHGFEIETRGEYYINPHARKSRTVLVELLRKLKKQLVSIKGIQFEDKHFTASLHYRNILAREKNKMMRIFWKTIIPHRKKMRITEGKKVLELRPPLNWDKGKAVLWILSKLKTAEYLPVYIGDDKTDESAFLALKPKGLTVRVGKSRGSAAKYVLFNIGKVYKFLSKAADCKTGFSVSKLLEFIKESNE